MRVSLIISGVSGVALTRCFFAQVWGIYFATLNWKCIWLLTKNLSASNLEMHYNSPLQNRTLTGFQCTCSPDSVSITLQTLLLSAQLNIPPGVTQWICIVTSGRVAKAILCFGCATRASQGYEPPFTVVSVLQLLSLQWPVLLIQCFDCDRWCLSSNS